MGWLGSILAGSNGTLGGDINQSGQIAGFVDDRSGGGFDVHAHGVAQDVGQGGFSKPGSVRVPVWQRIQPRIDISHLISYFIPVHHRSSPAKKLLAASARSHGACVEATSMSFFRRG